MPTFFIVVVVSAGLAIGTLTREIAAEYVAKYIVDNEESGVAKTAPRSFESDATAVGRPVKVTEAVPVLASVAAAGAAAAEAAPPAPQDRSEPSKAADAPDAAPRNAEATAPDNAADTAVAAQTVDAPAEAEASGTQAPLMEDAENVLALLPDTPHRRTDGSVFLPMASQRVFGLRTALTERGAAPVTVELPGRVIADPSTAALVQSHQAGLIEVNDSGRLPFGGQHVRQGDILAYLRPVFTTLERAEMDSRIKDLENQIDMARKRMAQLEQVMFVRFREGKIEAVRVEIAGLQRHLSVLRASQTERVPLRARTDGVVSHVEVAAGQYVSPGSTLFELVDPSRLWVSAAAFTPDVAERVEGATAVTADGQRLDLRFVGGGLTLRNQAIPLQFEILGATPGLTVDKPVTVFVRTRSQEVAGVKVPRSSLVRTNDGRYMLWERRTAETFVSHQVTTVPVDSGSVLVVSELSPSLRVVTNGSAVLSQVR
ncbi:MAG: efflux RND transporter periplasmic adaptor subunit [Alphaproteobacteria bacterium]